MRPNKPITELNRLKQQFPTLPEIRFGRYTFSKKSRWAVLPNYSDEVLASRKWACASQDRTLANIPEAEWPEVIRVLSKTKKQLKSSPGDYKKMRDYLSRMPCGARGHWVDIDVSERVAKTDGPSCAMAFAITVARKIEARTGCVVRAYLSGSKGGIHLEVIPPAGIWSLDTPNVIGDLVVSICEESGIPHTKKKGASTADVHVDLSVLYRARNSKGTAMRIVGSKKGPGQLPKRPLDLGLGAPRAMDKDKFQALLQAHVLLNPAESRSPERPARNIRKLNLSGLPLCRFAEVLKSIFGGKVARHEARLGISGFLARSGVPDDAAAATIDLGIPSHDTPEDAQTVVETTRWRLDNEETVSSLSSLVRNHIITDEDAKRLRAALRQDVAEEGESVDPQGQFNREERQVALQARRIIIDANKQRASYLEKKKGADHLFGIAHCSEQFVLARECGNCNNAISQTPMRCRRNGCMGCAKSTAFLWAEWIKATWNLGDKTDPVYLAKIPIVRRSGKVDYSLEKAISVRDEFLRRLSKNFARRCMVAPGYILIVMDKQAYSRLGSSMPPSASCVQLQSATQAAIAFQRAKIDIYERIARHIHARRPELLAEESWLAARKVVSSNKSGNEKFPWFDDATLRAFGQAKRGDVKEYENFLASVLATKGVASERKEAVKKFKATRSLSADEYCSCCGPFEQSRWVAYHKQTKQIVVKTMPGEPAPSFMQVARTWSRMQSARTYPAKPAVVSYPMRN